MPPLVGVAVNVTLVPAQMVFVVEVMLAAGVKLFTTVIVIVLLFAVVVVAQLALLVIVQDTISPLTRPAAVYVEELVPTFPPFYFH